jgi:hypothetical protein
MNQNNYFIKYIIILFNVLKYLNAIEIVGPQFKSLKKFTPILLVFVVGL